MRPYVYEFLHALERRGARKSTLSCYRTDLLHLVVWAEARHLTTWRDLDADAIRDWLACADRVTTRARRLSTARTFWAWLVAAGLADEIHPSRVEHGDRRGRRLTPYAPEVTVAQVAAAAETIRDAAVIWLVAAGIPTDRIGRISRQEAAAPDFLDSLPASAERAVRRLRAEPQRGRSGRLILNYAGRPLSRQAVWGVVRAAAERAGLGPLTPRALRLDPKGGA